MLDKFLEVESLRGLLPFVRSVYSRPSYYHWVDEHGERRQIRQQEGGEQGDPLMPLLFTLAVHNALVEEQAELQPGEFLFFYVLSLLERIRKIYDLLAEKLHSRVGIRLHTGKTRTWNRAAEIPEGMAELGLEVWSSVGWKVLGSPVGTPEYIQEAAQERLAVEADFWRKNLWVPDLQCAWQLLANALGQDVTIFFEQCLPTKEWSK